MDYQQEYYKKELLDREVKRLTLSAIKERKGRDKSYSQKDYELDCNFINECQSYTELKKYYKSKAKVGDVWYKRIKFKILSFEGSFLDLYLSHINKPMINLTITKKKDVISTSGSSIVLTKSLIGEVLDTLLLLPNENKEPYIKGVLLRISEKCQILYSSILEAEQIKLRCHDLGSMEPMRLVYPKSKEKYPELYKVLEVELAQKQYSSLIKYLYNRCIALYGLNIVNISEKIGCNNIFEKFDSNFFNNTAYNNLDEVEEVNMKFDSVDKFKPQITTWNKPILIREEVNVLFNMLKECNIINKDVQRQSMDIAISVLTGYSEKQIHKGTNTPSNQLLRNVDGINKIQQVLRNVIEKLEKEKQDF